MRIAGILFVLLCFCLQSVFADEFQYPKIRRVHTMDRIAVEVSQMEFIDQVEPENQDEEQKESWIKRHPVITGTLIGFGAGALVGQTRHGDDLNFFGKAIYFGGFGAGIGAIVGKVAAEWEGSF